MLYRLSALLCVAAAALAYAVPAYAFDCSDGTNTVSTFLHAPQGVLPPVRPGGPQDNCDGKGLDSLEECFGD